MEILRLLINILSLLALPVILVCLYDKFVLEPKRPKGADGKPVPGPTYVRVANSLLLIVIAAAVIRIGLKEVFDWASAVANPLILFAIPVGLWCAIDSWFLAPRRQIAAGSTDVPDPPLMRAVYAILPVFVVAPVVRMVRAEALDFSFVLLMLTLVTGLVWGMDQLVFRKRREAAAALAAGGPLILSEPGTVDYARSFFPVALIVLIVRAFIFEPFRIPSDSMMPTLLDGDFIVVNKFAYGLRLPVLNQKFIDTGTPQRGDVVVFRYPPDPKINYIKRLVGLPGDRIEVHDDHLVVNGETIALETKGQFADGCYVGLKLSSEVLGKHTHKVMSCHSPHNLIGARGYGASDGPAPLPNCDRKQIAAEIGGWICEESGADGVPDNGDHVFDVVPAGHYLMIGDNRDNSADSRVWGFVPDENVVGKATRIWFNFDLQRSNVVNWSRIGNSID